LENIRLDIEVYDDLGALARSFLGSSGLCFGSTMYRSSALMQIRFDEERFGIIWDRPFLLDLARPGKSAVIRTPLVLYRRHPGQDTKTGALTAQNLIELMRAYRAVLPRHWSRADQQLFYGHARVFLNRYGYARLAPDQRNGAFTFIRTSIHNKVLRVRDIRPGSLAIMLRADGKRALPCALDAVRAVTRLFLWRPRRAENYQTPSPRERGQVRHPED